MTGYILLAAGAAAVVMAIGAIIGGLWMSARRADELALERIRRRGAEKEIADLRAQQDIDNAAEADGQRVRSEQKAADDAEYNQLVDEWNRLVEDFEVVVRQRDHVEALARDLANRVSAQDAVPAEEVDDDDRPIFWSTRQKNVLPSGTGYTIEIQRDLARYAQDLADQEQRAVTR